MATDDLNNVQVDHLYDILDDVDIEDTESTESQFSFLDDGPDHPIEKILAEFIGKSGHIWYLVKWQDCPLVNSSWECKVAFKEVPWIFDEWSREKQRIAEGKSKEFDIVQFSNLVSDLESKQRLKRELRRYTRVAERALADLIAE